ncbi:MAG: M23 family peptidase [Rhodospirillaceae bacterium]|nr:M23 family peptidase [Rhodospirillaceae bacterium]
MAKALWPGLSLCVGAGLGAAATLFLPITGTDPSNSSPLASLFSTSPASADFSQTSEIELDLAGVELAVRRVATAALDASKTVKLKAGDTLSDVLGRAGVGRGVTGDIVEALKAVYNPRRLQSGQALTLNFANDHAADDRHLDELTFELSPGERVAVERSDDGTYSARTVIAETHREMQRFDGVISSSLFAAADKAGVPDAVLTEMVKIFSYDVDFQRDIQEGDTFSVMFERTVTKDGRVVRTNGIRVAAMTLSGTTTKLYAFRQSDGYIEFYNEKGEGVRKALSKTPINGAKLTSGFGLRRHPILGYSKMHQGIDFGAPTGTRVLAAGDGVIEKRESNGGYGNYVRIRHGSGYATAYAHLNRFGLGTQVGTRVKQNQVIGYVGSTGRSTGPHLHYEILRDNRQVNPMTVKFPSSEKLDGPMLARFKEIRGQTDRQYASLSQPKDVAMKTPGSELGALR